MNSLLSRILSFAFFFPIAVLAQNITRESVVAAAKHVEELAEQQVAAGAVPGIAVGVVFNDEVILAKGFGNRKVGEDASVDADTVFQLASVSKPIGSTVVAALVGEGKLRWDSRISDLDPGFEMFEPWVTREITIRDLYSHRSGLPEHAGDLLEDLGYTREAILYRLRFQHPDTSFRSGYAYTNFGLTEAAVAAAKAAGHDWETLSEEKLYTPLGMRSTSSRFPDFESRGNRALGHVMKNGKWVHETQRQPDAQSPAGGVSSSVNDLTKWMRLQLGEGSFEGKRVVGKDALGETHHPQILTGFSPLDGLPEFYGLGWGVSYNSKGLLRLSHSGAFDMGAATFVGLIPAEKLGIVVLTNASPIGVPEAIGNTFLDTVLYGKPRKDWLPLFRSVFKKMTDAQKSRLSDFSTPPEPPHPSAGNAAYVGAYTNEFFGKIEIIERDGGLAIGLGPDQAHLLPLKHWDRDTFYFETFGEFAAGKSGVLFMLDPEGSAMRVLVENLKVNGNGTFERIAVSSGKMD